MRGLDADDLLLEFVLEAHDDVFHGFAEGDADIDAEEALIAVAGLVVGLVAGDEEGVVLDFSWEVSGGPELSEEIVEHVADSVAQVFSVDFKDDPLGVFEDGSSDGVEDTASHEVSPFGCGGEGAGAPRTDASRGDVAEAVDAFFVEFGELSFVHVGVEPHDALKGDVCGCAEDADFAVIFGADAGHETAWWDGDGFAFSVIDSQPWVIEGAE